MTLPMWILVATGVAAGLCLCMLFCAYALHRHRKATKLTKFLSTEAAMPHGRESPGYSTDDRSDGSETPEDVGIRGSRRSARFSFTQHLPYEEMGFGSARARVDPQAPSLMTAKI